MTKNNFMSTDPTEASTEKNQYKSKGYSKKALLLVFVIVFFVTMISVSIALLAKASTMRTESAAEVSGKHKTKAASAHRSKDTISTYTSDVEESSSVELIIATSTMSSSPSASTLPMYCPLKDDLVHSWGTANVYDQGWTITTGGGVNTKSTYNLLGGSIEFDINFNNTNSGVNANIFSVSPPFIPSTGYDSSIGLDCDGSRTDDRWCVEIDWIESNGKCGGATSFHTIKGFGSGHTYYFDDSTRRGHMKISYDLNGFMTFTYENIKFNSSALQDTPTSKDYAAIVNAYKTRGALVASTQWVGWEPLSDCGPNGSLDGSVFSIENLVIIGSVVQGPIPTKCK